jgi:hypothetical protein
MFEGVVFTPRNLNIEIKSRAAREVRRHNFFSFLNDFQVFLGTLKWCYLKTPRVNIGFAMEAKEACRAVEHPYHAVTLQGVPSLGTVINHSRGAYFKTSVSA